MPGGVCVAVSWLTVMRLVSLSPLRLFLINVSVSALIPSCTFCLALSLMASAIAQVSISVFSVYHTSNLISVFSISQLSIVYVYELPAVGWRISWP